VAISPSPSPHQPETLAVTAGRSAADPALAPSIATATTWASHDLDDAGRRAMALRSQQFYSRYANPTVNEFERAIAELEGAEAALATASGMGAIATTVLALCSTGDHLVASRQLYAGTLAFLQGPCARLGLEVTFVDSTRPGALTEAVRPGRTMMVLVETPSNPRLDLIDLDEVGALKGPFTVVDATFATPLGQRTLAHGVDLVLHSATKGLGGHNDATLGVVAGERDLVDALWGYAVLHGATPSPHDAHAVLRGIRTLGVRFERQCTSALAMARWLEQQPDVAWARHPLLESHPQHDLARRQLHGGGGMVSFEMEGGAPQARRFADALGLCRLATSLGGPDTLVCHPATSTHASLSDDERRSVGITDGLLRMSVGLEHLGDLMADIERALAASRS
jgi:cystathionine beta-lyase/cystathionine gamma-synthase